MQHQKLKEAAQQILRENIYPEERGGGYTAASGRVHIPGQERPRSLYPFQWLWDTFFIAGWTEDTEQAQIDVERFLASQGKDGSLGHIRYNREVLERREYFPPPQIYYPKGNLPSQGEITSKIIQPPNAGYGLAELSKKLIPNDENKAFLKRSFDKVLHYHEYLYMNLVQGGLLVTTHPWEAGMDDSPAWELIHQRIQKTVNTKETVIGWLKEIKIPYERADLEIVKRQERPTGSYYDFYLYLIYLYGKWGWDRKKILAESPFRVHDPASNAILARSNLALSQLGEELDKNTKVVKKLQSWAASTSSALEDLWDEERGLYFPRDLSSQKLIKVETVASYLPLFSQTIEKKRAQALAQRIRALKEDPELKYLVPSTSPKEKYFQPRKYWRGPAWLVVNEMLAEGLKFYGEEKLAREIRMGSLKLVQKTLDERGGFYEYYHPQTGEGLGSPRQSWTATVVLKVLREL